MASDGLDLFPASGRLTFRQSDHAQSIFPGLAALTLRFYRRAKS
jgi:hypothetical protein